MKQLQSSQQFQINTSQKMSRYQQAKKQAFYNMISQKISQKIDSLPEISCISQRWIWELIQNAKDSDSEFDKIKIKIEIHDNKFVFSHNGNPFTMENLESLIFHYSAKDEQNKNDVETTGKYGTGFMVTYTVSKKVFLQCKFKGMPDICEQQLNKDDEPAFMKEEYPFSPSKQVSTPNAKLLTNKKKGKDSKIKEKSISELPYYQDFKIFLDRSYENVKELKDKIIQVDKSVERQLKHNEKDRKYVRTQQSFDTCFVYGELDAASFKHISIGMNSLKQLFPLVLLFNKKLYSLEVINCSTKLPDLRSFEIVRENKSTIQIFSIFAAKILEFGYDPKTLVKTKVTSRIQQYLYSQINEISGIVAFPVQIVGDKINLCRFPEKFPKMFKEFPLIGCEDIGFNFAFTSKELYPSENRKQLLLKQIQGRKCPKADKNWEILDNLFAKAHDLYVLLARRVSKGKFNLFIAPKSDNFLYNAPQIKKKIFKLINITSKFEIFQSGLKKQRTIQQFQIFYQDNEIAYSKKTYNLFKFMVPQSLLPDDYEEFCQLAPLHTNQLVDQLKAFKCKFITLQECIDRLSQITYPAFLKFFSNQAEAQTRLEKIYQFIIQNRRSLLYQLKSKIILTQSLQFKSFFINEQSALQIEVDFTNKHQYFEIADSLRIPYKDHLIHHRFTKIFEQEKVSAFDDELKPKSRFFLEIEFTKQSLLRMIQQYFYQKQKGVKNELFLILELTDLIKLGRYLSSFSNIQLLELNLAYQINSFKFMKPPLCHQIITTGKNAIQKQAKTLMDLYKNHFKREITGLYRKSKTINDFTSLIVNKNYIKAIELINYLYSNGLITHSQLPNADQEIALRSALEQLKWLRQGYDYLTLDDIELYDTLCQKCNKQIGLNMKPIKKTLVHPKISLPLDSNPNIITYASLFQGIKAYYNQNNIKVEYKEMILNYTFKIYEEYVLKNNKAYKNKFELFKEIINQRHLEFGKLLNTLEDKDKDLICKIFKMKQKFSELREIIENYRLDETLATMRMISKPK